MAAKCLIMRVYYLADSVVGHVAGKLTMVKTSKLKTKKVAATARAIRIFFSDEFFSKLMVTGQHYSLSDSISICVISL